MPADPESGKGRRWLARPLFEPRTLVSMGRTTWWPFQRLGYWAMLDPTRARARDLARCTLGGAWDPDAESDRADGLVAGGSKLCSLGVAAALCLLPYGMFPV